MNRRRSAAALRDTPRARDRAAALLIALASLALVTCGGSVSTGRGGSGGSAQTNKFPCVDPRPIVVNGVDTGFDTCKDLLVRRRKAVECPDLLPGNLCSSGACSTDADCGGVKPYGHCDLGAGNACQCMPGCRTDADCGAGSICFCGAVIGYCVKSNCTTDASCGGGLCASYVTNADPCGTGFACQTTSDECGSRLDCPDGEECGYDGKRHACRSIICLL